MNLGIHVSWEDSALYVELGGSEAYLKYLHLKSASDPCKDRAVVQMQSASSWGLGTHTKVVPVGFYSLAIHRSKVLLQRQVWGS